MLAGKRIYLFKMFIPDHLNCKVCICNNLFVTDCLVRCPHFRELNAEKGWITVTSFIVTDCRNAIAGYSRLDKDTKLTIFWTYTDFTIISTQLKLYCMSFDISYWNKWEWRLSASVGPIISLTSQFNTNWLVDDDEKRVCVRACVREYVHVCVCGASHKATKNRVG